MIIREIELENFGIYGGLQRFKLKPESADGFNRPIVLFKGKNGAGKTSLTEAIRLCLHGSLALGGRIGRSEYHNHLIQRLHRPDNSEQSSQSARLNLEIEYVDAGRRCIYQIERRWEKKQDKVKETVDIRDLNEPDALRDLKTDQERESFLQELMPPRVADIFFFDGEKLELLASDNAAASLLQDTMETLFGLNMVRQLQDDLDVYLTRQSIEDNAKSLQTELRELRQRKEEMEQGKAELFTAHQNVEEKLAQTRRLMHEQEQKIAGEGGWFAERLQDSRETKQRLETEIDILRKQAQDMANGLLPFAIVPQFMQQVAHRLHLEHEFEQTVSAQRVLAQKFNQISKDLTHPNFWTELDVNISDTDRNKLLSKLEQTLQKNAQPPDIASDEIMLRVSEQDRQILYTWIDRAADEVPRQFCQIVHRLNGLEDELKRVEREITLAPAEETLNPLVETYQLYLREEGGLEKTAADLSEQIQKLKSQLTQLEPQMERTRQQLLDLEKHNQRIHLALQSHKVLDEYLQRLRVEKVKILEQVILRRFNQLCRKEDLISGVVVDSESFRITLLRRGQTFERKQLSAGEKQLLATATIWALREVSNTPMPVILDTPLGRLDSDHRLSMLEYFTQASHQVILLATDTEVDSDLEARLQPAISHTYDLDELHHPPRFTEATFHHHTNGRSAPKLSLVKEEVGGYETE